MVSRASNSNDDRAAVMSRRGVLRIGGLSVGAAALAAACGEHARGEIGRVGAVPTTVKLPDAIVTNVTLLRTASSLEYSIINVYSQIVGKSDLLDPKYDEMIQRFMDDHTAQAKALEQLTTAAGGTAWTCSNPKIDDLIINPVITRVTKGTAATANAAAIKSSDDPRRDMLNFAHALETLAGESYQSFVPLLSE
ncbi:MAG TPA: ferritin-like domain-containing protein, partial [Ilumatobacteraceae bacterium]